MARNLILFSDGGSAPNPGPSSAAWVIVEDHQIIWYGRAYIGEANMDIAEYTGLIEGLRSALHLGQPGTHVIVRMDNEKIVNQVGNLRYKCKDSRLREPRRVAVDLLKEIESRGMTFQLEHIPRARNQTADRLVNLTHDDHKCEVVQAPHKSKKYDRIYQSLSSMHHAAWS